MNEALQELLIELESTRLEVGLAPSRRRERDWDMIRVVMSRNCRWYRSFCARHASSRVRRNAHFDTRIRRQAVVRIINQLLSRGSSTSKYAVEILQIARERQAKAA
jgi:hypothetical protein